MTNVSGSLVKNLQLGVGKSVIVDLPEDASEIYVGDPRIANAVVRSARRIYVSAIANGQTTIFALGRDGQKIGIVEVSVGRDVGRPDESSQRGDSRQRYSRSHRGQFDHPDRIGRVGRRRPEGHRHRVRLRHRRPLARSRSAQTASSASGGSSGKVINSLTIRGLDQVSLRVTVAEIRREVVKQLGVTMSGSGSERQPHARQPVRDQRRAFGDRRRR